MKSICFLLFLVCLGVDCRPNPETTSKTIHEESQVISYAKVNGDKPVLKGITLEAEPFVRLTRNRKAGENPFEGYLIDLLDAINKETPFSYSLKLDTSEGFKHHTDIIKQVKDKNFDFALADITVTEDRKKDADFTEPFFNITLAAIVRKTDFESAKTLKDLVEATHNNDDIKYAIIKNGATHDYLSKSTDPLAAKIWTKLSKDMESGLISNKIRHQETLDKIRKGNLILFLETPRADYVKARDCDLKNIKDDGSLSDYKDRQQAIMLKKGSPELALFNNAIKKLTNEGKLTELQDKYWKKTTCSVPVSIN